MRAIDVKEAMRFLRAAGKRVTDERKLLLRIISEHPHLDASEIYRLAKQDNPKISLSTVYRTVNLLKELGLVKEVSLGGERKHYEVRWDEHYHFVCLGCGKVIELPALKEVRRLGEEQGLEILGVKLELVGYCNECRGRGEHGAEWSAPLPGSGKADGVIDLRGVSMLEHPGRVSHKVEGLREGERLEILTDDPRRLKLAPKMLEQIEGIEIIRYWREGLLCHALVKKK
ncbi:MAG: transcriptional repressor [Candidatus Bipolaricaulota bacterium]|nr:transcriptional repressor [Candidatus Bipolaricaulota bacterium]